MPIAEARPQLLTVSQAAALLNVSDGTVRRWIEDARIPYLELPGRGYRVPQSALLASLRDNYDLAAELGELDRGRAQTSEQDVRDALADAD